MDKSIWVTFQVEGLHQWKESTTYLKYPHRHLFHFRVEVGVMGSNREIEFIGFRREVKEYVQRVLLPDVVITKSCEMLAEDLVHRLLEMYGDRDYTVEVSEDGENGAKVSCYSSTC